MKIAFIYKPYESLGIELLISVLRKNNHQAKLFIDYDYFNDGLLNIPFLYKNFHFQEKIINGIKEFKPDLVAFSVVTDNYQWALSLAKKVKEETNVPIIFGGVHPTALTKEVLKNNFIDLICRGEGEDAILELAEEFDKKGKIVPGKIQNFAFKKNGKIFVNTIRPLIENLDKLPFPEKDEFYDRVPRLKQTYRIMTSRGCYFSCSYCWNSFYRSLYSGNGKYLRRRSVENVVQELILAKKRWNFEKIGFLDDLFALDKKWIFHFTEEIKKTEVFGTPFYCSFHPAMVDKELVSMLRSIGCEEGQLGVQSVSAVTRKKIIFRPETNNQIIKSARLIKSAGIRLMIDHMAGLPGEGEKEQIQAIELYNKIRPSYVSFFWLQPYPGTKVYDYLREDKKNNCQELELSKEGKTLFDPYKLYGERAKEFIPFEYLISILVILPPRWVDYIIKKKIYRFFKKPSLIIGQGVSRIIVSIFQRDSRYVKSYFDRYKDLIILLFRRDLF